MSEPTATWRRRPGPGFLAGAATLVVIVVAVATTLVFTFGREDSTPSTPAETVSAFLRAVADADSAAALALMTEPPSREFLTSDALARAHAVAAITDVSLRELGSGESTSGSTTPVAPRTPGSRTPAGSVDVGAEFRIGGHPVRTTYRTVRDGRRWLVDDGLAAVDLAPSTIPGLSLQGRPVAGIGTAYVFPGRLVWGSSNRYLAVTDSTDVTGGAVAPTTADPGVTLGDAGNAAVDSALHAYLDRCASSAQADASTDRPGCTQRLYRSAEVSSVRWRAPSSLHDLVRELDSATLTSVSVFGGVTWQAHYTATYGGDAVAEVDQPMNGAVDLDAQPVPTYSSAG
ncbi:hypothetical protein EF294_17185 [Gordonia oryzae]|uniref:DUF4878 domain-containing protein n=1 Tax=Gordonia oryzae TaxID=2487349 RepID=A0A3N4G4J5_9ACTN|nr:hypothetical protein [Gordonia oryzae]RPA57812.1 hypothetical protein EF294_17185 [Gordonia oryzae]